MEGLGRRCRSETVIRRGSRFTQAGKSRRFCREGQRRSANTGTKSVPRDIGNKEGMQVICCCAVLVVKGTKEGAPVPDGGKTGNQAQQRELAIWHRKRASRRRAGCEVNPKDARLASAGQGFSFTGAKCSRCTIAVAGSEITGNSASPCVYIVSLISTL